MIGRARALLAAVGLPALLGLAVLTWIAFAAAGDAAASRFEFKPGLVFDYLVSATPGDPQHHVRVVLTDVADGGYKVAIRMPEVNVDATQTVSHADLLTGRCQPPRVYSGDATQAGCTNMIRVADVIYRDLKAGRLAEIDETPNPSEATLTTSTGAGRMRIQRDGRPVWVHAVSGYTAESGYAVNDDPRFPFNLYGLIEVWSPPALGARLRSDLTWTGRARTTAIIFFPDNRLDPLSETLLGYVADWLKAHPDKNLQVKVVTDDALSREDAQALAGGRAGALRAAFQARGVDPGRLVLIAEGHDRWPTPETAAYSQKERVEFRVIDGKRASPVD